MAREDTIVAVVAWGDTTVAEGDRTWSALTAAA